MNVNVAMADCITDILRYSTCILFQCHDKTIYPRRKAHRLVCLSS